MNIDPKIEAIVAKLRDNPRALINFASTYFLSKGDAAQARKLCAEALRGLESDPEFVALAKPILAHGIGAWYFTMVQDANRHRKYADAFAVKIKAGDVVLDIGAGTGLFAMMAARAGAGTVIACEQNEAVADVVRKTVELNGLSSRIQVVAKSSLDLVLGVDLPRKADVLIWDNLANDLVGQGALAAVRDASRRLLKPGAVVIPSKVEVVVCPAEDIKPAHWSMGAVEGFDLSPFNELATGDFTVSSSRLVRRAAPATIFEIDFSADSIPSSREGDVVFKSVSGSVNGVAQWLRFHLTDELIYDTRDDPDVMAFGTKFHPTFMPAMRSYEAVQIKGLMDATRLYFWI